MVVGIPVALLLTAQSAAGTAQPAPAAPTSAERAVESAPKDCSAAEPKSDSREIVICAQRSDGYRLNPDIMEARREVRRDPGRLKTPGERRATDGCSVGPQGCQTAGINLIAAGIAAASMAARLAQGKEIGSMFVTDRHPDEYHRYLAAKHRREAEEAQAAAEKAKAKAEAADAAAGDPKPAPKAD